MKIKAMRNTLVLSVFAALLCGCLSVYKAEIQQGNVVTQDMIDKLKPGMTRSQVRFVLGTPLVTDMFHPERWDYYYFLRRANEKTVETQRLTVIFKNDLLLKVQEDIRLKSNAPGSKDSDTHPAPAASSSTQPDTVRYPTL
jgi:outer membrane protein assembly factor BamE